MGVPDTLRQVRQTPFFSAATVGPGVGATPGVDGTPVVASSSIPWGIIFGVLVGAALMLIGVKVYNHFFATPAPVTPPPPRPSADDFVRQLAQRYPPSASSGVPFVQQPAMAPPSSQEPDQQAPMPRPDALQPAGPVAPPPTDPNFTPLD